MQVHTGSGEETDCVSGVPNITGANTSLTPAATHDAFTLFRLKVGSERLNGASEPELLISFYP
jgi:hypothetical protein